MPQWLFSWKNSNRCRIDDYLSVHYIGVTALLTGLTIVMTSLHVLCMYLIHDCINCLQRCYMASKHCITLLALPNNKLYHLLWQMIEQAIVFIVPVMLQWMFTYMLWICSLLHAHTNNDYIIIAIIHTIG